MKMTVITDEAGEEAGFIIFHKDTRELEEARAALARATRQFRKEAALSRQPEASVASENRIAADFCKKLMQPVRYRYGDNGAKAVAAESPACLPPGAAAGDGNGDHADSPSDSETTDPYLEIRKTSGGPLDSAKLAELAELMKRLG